MVVRKGCFAVGCFELTSSKKGYCKNCLKEKKHLERELGLMYQSIDFSVFSLDGLKDFSGNVAKIERLRKVGKWR
jgi:hypothetical protein